MSRPAGARSRRVWPIADTAPFAARGRLAKGTNQHVSRYGDAVWDLSVLNDRSHQPAFTVHWDTFPEPLRPTFRRLAWALINLPTPEELLYRAARSRTERVAVGTISTTIAHWRRFARWLDERDLSQLAQVSSDDLEDYATDVANTALSRGTATGILYAVTRIWGFAPHLPAADQIPMPPWERYGMVDYVPAFLTANENATEPIHPAVMSPLLIWALRFVQEFADDIMAASDERQRLAAAVSTTSRPEAAERLRALVEHHRATGQPLPGGVHRGRRVAAAVCLAATTNASLNQVRYAVNTLGKDLPIGDQAPLGIQITGRVHGQPWTPHINYFDVPLLLHRLSTACLVTIAYLSGMRPGEVLRLRTGCCPEPVPDSSGAITYRIFASAGKTSSSARPDETVVRGTPWTVIPPVVDAIRILERLTNSSLLFPATDTAWSPISRGSRQRIRPGNALTSAAANHRIGVFIDWINNLAEQHGLTAEPIPADPAGPLSISRFRRTIAWHIARRPNGRIALAVQYGHLRSTTSTITDGYSSRGRHGLRRVLDIETARAIADYLGDLADRLDTGERISGPAANRLIDAARQARIRYAGLYLTPRQAEALITEPRLQVYDNPQAFLTCNYDPANALCHPDRATSDRRILPPSLERCDPACSNIARTDAHIAQLRQEIASLNEEIASPLTPTPLRERFKQRAVTLRAIAARHDRTRTSAYPQGPTDE